MLRDDYGWNYVFLLICSVTTSSPPDTTYAHICCYEAKHIMVPRMLSVGMMGVHGGMVGRKVRIRYGLAG